jgi:hypothetical protein
MMSSTLTAAGEANYYEPVLLPDPYKSAKVLPERPGKTITGNHSNLKLFPNPAGSYFIVEYEMEEVVSHAMIRITDVLGRELKKIKVTKQFDQVVINTTSLKEGVYFVVFEVNGIIQYTEKLTVAK